ncbi:KH domain-containing protein [bacterium]|nr:KH domain-containing protein [bacterium]
MAERDQEFVDYVVKTLVDNPDKVETSRTIDERGVLIELKVDPSDMGKIIGKEGKTAKSIRTLLRVVGAKNDARVNLKIVEPEGSERPQPVQEESPAVDVAAEVAPEAPVAPVEEVKEASSIDDIKL